MALNDIGKAAIADAKPRIAKYERKIKVYKDYIELMQSKCDHDFTQSGPLQQCTICGLTEKK